MSEWDNFVEKSEKFVRIWKHRPSGSRSWKRQSGAVAGTAGRMTRPTPRSVGCAASRRR